MRANSPHKNLYPSMRYAMQSGRVVHGKTKELQSKFLSRHDISPVIPDCYTVCNTTTIDQDLTLNVLTGQLPTDIDGTLYICQCLGTPSAFMVGDTNLVKMKFKDQRVTQENRLMWNPVAIARMALENTKHRFDYFGLMFLSPGLGMYSYTEGMYLLPDGRLGITSDVDRPWIVNRDTLKVETALGSREQWLPMMAGSAGEAMGNLFSGYSNSHVIYTDVETNELFMVNYQYEQADKTHPCQLMKWDGKESIECWSVVDESGAEIRIMQSIHELIFTRDYILLADTAFVAGMEMLTPWKNAPLPDKNTIVYIVDRRDMVAETKTVVAKRVVVGEACIHLIADYENPDQKITIYMLHTPATNTAEIIKDYDVDLNGKLFPKHTVGYGTLPVLDLSSVGKHIVDMNKGEVAQTQYITDPQYCWGPYMYTYMDRQVKNFQDQDLFVMFKGFSKDMLPKRIYNAYKDVDNRRYPLEKMVSGEGLQCNNSIARITKDPFEIADGYVFPDKVLLYTISCLPSAEGGDGYVIAGVCHDVEGEGKTSGHEYWIFQADNLAQGAICTLGHKDLCNSVLFHTVFISREHEERLNQTTPTYRVPMEQDYPRDTLDKWDSVVTKTFDELIYPYYKGGEGATKVEQTLRQFATRRICEHAGHEHLIEEIAFTHATDHAELMFDEANRMFSTTGWQEESHRDGVLVESKPISGKLACSGVCVTRASGIIQTEADKFFAYMSSPQGYAVIDPVSDPNDHEKKPLDSYPWREGCRLEVALATTNIPMMAPCDFVVLNAIDPKVRMFASKSVLHDSIGGGSKYADVGPSKNGRERALNTFVIKVEPIDQKTCRVLCINYADMAGKTSAKMNNFVNQKVFFKPLYERMKKAAKTL